MKVIIIGAGIAAVSAVKAIRRLNRYIDITVYGEEPYYPYKRLRLTKDLADGLKAESLLIEKESWYEDNRVELQRNKKVIRIDPAEHKIYLSDNTTDHYSALLLANGAVNNVLPIKGIDKKGVYTLRNLADASAILEKAGNAQKALVIGGGVLGLEISWSLKKLGKDITVVEALPRLMPKQLDENASRILLDVVQSHGIEVFTGSQVKEITGEQDVTGFVTDKNKQRSCDMVIHSTGIKPNIDLVKGTGIHTNRGILVNERMETNIPDIYAAGDIAEYQGSIPGLWSVASLQGEVAGSNIAGLDRVYQEPAVATVMNAFNYSMFSIGEAEALNADNFIINEDAAGREYHKVLFKDGVVTGAVFMGSIKELPAIKKAIEEKLYIPEVYTRELQVSDFLSLLKEKQARKMLQPVGAALDA
ncbi:MAG TPA: NAD(P)/FAD-dependent oxidoreductase [Clostridiales bacterium]|nr:NAD(P)/FAD-dependent oxidoreductase [Clostridiales bacterium]